MSYPKLLADLPQWICWRYEPDPRADKPRKVPYCPKTGQKASSTNAATWASLADARAALERYTFSGLGFVFTADCGIVGVDIDHCRSEDGVLNETAQAILEHYPSYTEISPSGSGLHIFYHGAMPGKGNKNSSSGVEMYAAARYFTMTGNHLEGTPDDIADGIEALRWIHETYIAKPRAKKKAARSLHPVALTDEQVLEKARSAVNGEDFDSLWTGDWKDRYGSQSEADLALCCALAFWSGRNKEQMDRLFRQSALFREKWDVVHHASGATYGEETLEQALSRTEEVYSPGGDPGITESNGRYFRQRGENVYAITNFVVHPVEMLITEEETQMTCDLVTVRGETFRQTLMTTDFSTTQKFKGILNKHTIALSFSGSDGDLEALKVYVYDLEWKKKQGVKASGLHLSDGRWAYVDQHDAFTAGGERVDDMVQPDRYVSIESELPGHKVITAEQILGIGKSLLAYNEPAKTVTLLGWCCGCFVKEMLRSAGIKFPHLFLIGEAGSGKSTTLERIILPLFGRNKVIAAPQVTAFTLMKDAASSNLYPQALDEFKPSKIDRQRLPVLYNHFRDSYDGHDGVRGKADQTQVSYKLLAPLVLAGEESPDEPAVRERGMELLFSKKDLQSPIARAAFREVSSKPDLLASLGRALLDTALTLNTETVRQWCEEYVPKFNASLPSRVLNNLACCMTGLRVLDTTLERLGLTWSRVFDISLPDCADYMEFGVREYLLDGGNSNKSVVEQTLEVVDRMGLTTEECRPLDNGYVALWVKGFYDRYTHYRRDNAITGESLAYAQFMKQLKKSDMFVEAKVIQIGESVKRAVILDYTLIKSRCDVDDFLHSQAEPLI